VLKKVTDVPSTPELVLRTSLKGAPVVVIKVAAERGGANTVRAAIAVVATSILRMAEPLDFLG
jgi:hypothetical protein